MMLGDIRERVKVLEKQQSKIIVLLKANTDDEEEAFAKAETINQLLEMEIEVNSNAAYKKQLTKLLVVVGLTCTTARQHINMALDAIMSVQVQTKVNVCYGNDVQSKGYYDHVAFKKQLPTMFAIILAVVSKTWTFAEKILQTFMSEWLKNAPKRAERQHAKLA
jgi:hypothetical protein